MARLTEAVLKGAYTDGENDALTLDLKYGGQFGYNPKLGIIGPDGKIKAEWLSNKAYIARNVIPILIEAPRGFGLMPNPEKWVAALKALIETHARSIDGLVNTLTVETAEHPLGGSNEVMEEWTKVTKERTELTFNFIEKEGRSISRFIEKWITYLIAHHEIERPLLATLPNIVDNNVDQLADWYSATVLFIEPDVMHRKVIQAWLTGQVFPKGTGPIEGRFDKTGTPDITELSIPFAGFTQSNLGVKQFAQTILDKINIINANPYEAKAFVDEIHPDVDAIDTGYENTVKTLKNTTLSNNQ